MTEINVVKPSKFDDHVQNLSDDNPLALLTSQLAYHDPHSDILNKSQYHDIALKDKHQSCFCVPTLINTIDYQLVFPEVIHLSGDTNSSISYHHMNELTFRDYV